MHLIYKYFCFHKNMFYLLKDIRNNKRVDDASDGDVDDSENGVLIISGRLPTTLSKLCDWVDMVRG